MIDLLDVIIMIELVVFDVVMSWLTIDLSSSLTDISRCEPLGRVFLQHVGQHIHERLRHTIISQLLQCLFDFAIIDLMIRVVIESTGWLQTGSMQHGHS